MRSYLPVLKVRHRYIAFRLEAEGSPNAREIMAELFSGQTSLFGDVGTAENRLKLMRFDGQYGILRCGNGYMEQSRAVMAAIYAVAGIRAALRPLGVSGTVKGATEKYIPKTSTQPTGEERKRVELEKISGSIACIRDREIDISPDCPLEGSDTKYVGLTFFDLRGGCDDADGTSDGL